jgi:CBS domain-containing protein
MAQLRAPADEQRQQEALHGVEDDDVVVIDDSGGNESNKKARAGLCGVLRERKVVDLARAKRRLVEVPYTATLAHTANALLAARVSAVAVAAPPGHWIGAGGSMILESDPATGAVRKHYIGMVNMLDILAHIAQAGDEAEADAEEAVDLARRMAVPVSSVIGHSLEGLTLWTLHPSTSVLDCMETFSKGVHRSLVPLESSADNVVAVELVEFAPGYRMLTQMDVVRFLRAHGAELRGVLSRTVRELGAVNDAVFAVAADTKVIDAVKAMRAASLIAVPVVDDPAVDTETLQDVSASSSEEQIGDSISRSLISGSKISCCCVMCRGWVRRRSRRSRRRTCGTARCRGCSRGWRSAWRSSRGRWPSTGRATGPSSPAPTPLTPASRSRPTPTPPRRQRLLRPSPLMKSRVTSRRRSW